MTIKFCCQSSSLDIFEATATKFKSDSIAYESEDFSFRTCGIFLNEKESLERFKCTSLVELFQNLYEQNIPVPTVLNGTYVCVIYHKKDNTLHIYNDLLSKHSLFYYYDESSNCILCSDSFFETLQLVKDEKLPVTIDELGVKMMLWHRMFYDNITYVREIKFLRPFEYLTVENGNLNIHMLERQPQIEISQEEAAQKIHELFGKAVRLQYQKNEQNGYPQTTTLSGGMDSRSTFLYGLSNGYTQQTCYSYGESTSADIEIAMKLAIRNKCKFFVHTIDNGKFLLERDGICSANEGQMVYSGPSGTFDSLSFFNTSHMGIVHTGLGGGEIMGDMRVSDNPTRYEKFINQLKYRFGKGKKDNTWGSLFSSLRLNEEEKERLERRKGLYHDFCEFQNLNDMRRCLNSQKIAKSFKVEYVSPFLYEEFFCYLLRIPFELTKKRRLYLYWQKKYNPGQFETPSTFMLGCKPGQTMRYYIKRFTKGVLNKLGRKTKYDMNPMEFWLAQNPTIAVEQEKMFESDMAAIKGIVNQQLYKLIEESWKSNAAPHTNILTATWALKKIANGQ